MTIKITPRLLDEIDGLVEEGWYSSRSEAIRDAVREMIERKRYLKMKDAVTSDVKWGLYGE